MLTRASVASLVTIALNLAYLIDVLRLRLGPADLLVALPYLLANLVSVVMLALSLSSKPIKTDDRWGILLAAVAASNASPILHFAGFDLVSPDLIGPVSAFGQVAILLLVPFYIAAVLSLGRQLTVVPEARRLITSGPYRVSRHPLYVTYIIWHILQIAVAQTLIVTVLSVVMVVLLTMRAVREESVLASAFPAEYADYRAKVGWIGRWSPRFD